ncbi:MAG: glycosyltransferase [Acidobacteriia bacterium]|nr:glycosyltransferase [Terriglobia bacterium]
MTLLILSILFFLLWFALVPAYPFWLRRWRLCPRPQGTTFSFQWPRVDVLVAVRNEIGLIREKITNLKQLDYPEGSIRFWIVDGDSSDGTPRAALEAAGDDKRFVIMNLGWGNKVAQLNAALERGSGKWVLISDADAELGDETLKKMIREAEADPDVFVVGTPVHPANSNVLDQTHWEIGDGLRLLESDRGFASIVTAPCYIFRRDLIDAFPAGVFADDVHMAFAAFAQGKHVRYASCQVIERRCPKSFSNLLRHKRRKTHNYLVEIFRFLSLEHQMPTIARRIFLFRAAQILLAPFLILGSILAFSMFVWTRGFGEEMLIALGVALGFLFIAAWSGKRHLSVVSYVVTMTIVLLFTVVSYPFSKSSRTLSLWRLPDEAAAKQADSFDRSE